MALRARLNPSPPKRTSEPPANPTRWVAVRASKFAVGDRRMEAETYLSSGYGLRLAIEDRPSGWCRFRNTARVWMPGRLKGIQVGPEHGTPFLAATQVFDLRPVIRKWLSLSRTEDAAGRFVAPGTILVTRSGTVGRSTLASDVHADTLISDDLLRVEAIDPPRRGWLYAFLLSPQARAMMTGSHYGQIIKHLEPSHLEELPIPDVGTVVAADFESRARRVVSLRNESHRLTVEAEKLFESVIRAAPGVGRPNEAGFVVRASTFASGRRRLDASNHSPASRAVLAQLACHAKGFSTVAEAGYTAWLPNRFKRVPATNGVWLWGSSSLTEVGPQPTRRIADGDFGDPYRARVEPGWVVMARSGQVYGIIGAAVLASAAMADDVVSDDVMRIMPGPLAAFRPGYLVTAMSHPRLGRPLIKAIVYGSSIPHVDVADVLAFPVVRLDESVESAIADLAERAATARAEADIIELAMGRDAGAIVERFMHRPAIRLVTDGDGVSNAQDSAAEAEFELLAARWRAERPRGADIADMSATPACRAVVAMGMRAVRPILLQLRQKPEHWFAALHEITGANPVPAHAEGKLKVMAAAWIEWGRERGYVSELD